MFITELTCVVTLWFFLPPFGVNGTIDQAEVHGMCESPPVVSYLLEDDGLLTLESRFMSYKIALPTDQDSGWLTYKLGDTHAYIGGCKHDGYPFDDHFCKKEMQQISALGWR